MDLYMNVSIHANIGMYARRIGVSSMVTLGVKVSLISIHLHHRDISTGDEEDASKDTRNKLTVVVVVVVRRYLTICLPIFLEDVEKRDSRRIGRRERLIQQVLYPYLHRF